MYAYAITLDAAHDLEDIEDYIASYADLDFVDTVSDAFEAAFETLCDNPHAHAVYQFEPPTPTLHEYRSVNVYNYKVFYWIDEANERVIIYRIRHIVSDFSRIPL